MTTEEESKPGLVLALAFFALIGGCQQHFHGLQLREEAAEQLRQELRTEQARVTELENLLGVQP